MADTCDVDSDGDGGDVREEQKDDDDEMKIESYRLPSMMELNGSK